jgi:regulator of replication initiation timing
MEKIVEALTKLLPGDAVAEVTEAVKNELEGAKQAYEQEYSSKLEEAYAELSEELKSAEETAIQGYKEAYAIIEDLRNRLGTQQKEFELSMEEGYEEAYQMLIAEKGKNENLEVEMYDQFNTKLQEMKEYMVDKVDAFLQYKNNEIYKSVKNEVANDPRNAEHKVALDRVVECVAEYIGDENFTASNSAKVEEVSRKVEELKSQVKILEARNIRLSADNTKLTEAVRETQKVITESAKVEKKERVEKAKNAQGRGRAVNDPELVAEWNDNKSEEKKSNNVDTTLVESLDPDLLRQMQVLAGTKNND